MKTFIFDVENAENLILENCDRKLFLRSITAKLRGATKNSVDGFNFYDVKNLTKHLKKHFSNGHDFKSYHQELIRVAMLPDESISQYAARVQNLVRGAKAALAGTDKEAHANTLLEEYPKGCSLDGLPLETEVRLTMLTRKIIACDTAFERAKPRSGTLVVMFLQVLKSMK